MPDVILRLTQSILFIQNFHRLRQSLLLTIPFYCHLKKLFKNSFEHLDMIKNINKFLFIQKYNLILPII